MTNTGFGLPLRIDVASGERLEPTGLDPYSLPWVQGAAATVTRQIRGRYSQQVADLREKLRVLRSKRAKDAFVRDGTVFPAYGPRRRPLEFRHLDKTEDEG